MSELYEHDFFGWTVLQSQLLREGRFGEADLDHLAEEIEDLGRNRLQELRHRLAALLLHLLKWQYQPDKRTRSWRLTMMEQRARIADHLTDNPSLKPQLPDAVAKGYHYALLRIERETGLDANGLPPSCPYTPGQIGDGTFYPGEP